MKIYLTICAFIFLMDYLSMKIIKEKMQRNGYKKIAKVTTSEKLLGWMMLILFSILPIWNLLYLYVCIMNQDEMYEKMKKSDKYYKVE